MEKKKWFIIIGALILLVLVGVLIAVFLLNNNSSKSKTENFENRIMTLFDNSYKYYYYLYGDIKTGDGYIEVDGVTYYYVAEDLMSVREFRELVEDTFLNTMLDSVLEVENTNEYINVDDKIYVKKTENPCKNIHEYDFSDLYYDGDDEKRYAYYNQTRTAIYNEDGIWKLGNNIYVCESEE